MSNAVFTIRGTDIKGVSFKNDFKAKPGEKMNIQVKTNVAVKMNPAAPTNAVVLVKFDAADPEAGIELVVETITAIQTDTYVEDLEEVIKKEYINVVMLAVNERIKSVCANVGLNISAPAIVFGKNGSNGDIINFATKN